MGEFKEEWRLEADIGPSDLYVDCGAHKGWFLCQIKRKYRMRVMAFEPVRAFFDELEMNYAPLRDNRDALFRHGLGGYDRVIDFDVHDDSTSEYSEGHWPCPVVIKGVAGVLHSELPEIGLMEMNIEGGEYELLEAMFATGIISRVRNLQVQFHHMPQIGSEQRYKAIRRQLLATHNEVWGCEWVWQRFQRK